MHINKKILIINHLFPPFNGVGVVRVAKFVQYLPEFGWQPIVLTCKRPESQQDALDAERLQKLPSGIEVHRTWCPSLFDLYRLFGGKVKQGSFGLSSNRLYEVVRRFLVPDPYVGWVATALQQAKAIIEAHDINVILTSSPRESTHLIGWWLRKMYHIPWIADFRDPWIKKQHRPKRIAPLDRFEKHLQFIVLRDASHILVAWPGIAKGFCDSIAEIGTKTTLLTNGYDERDFENLTPKMNDKFTIIFAGALYKELASEPMFEALHILKKKMPDLIKNWRLVLLGRQDAYIKHLIQVMNLEHAVEIVDQMPYRECLRYLAGADVLFFSVPDHYWIPSKIYEYMRLGKPVIGIADPQSDAIHMMRSVGANDVVASRSPAIIAKALMKWYKSSGDHTCSCCSQNLHQYERHMLVQRLSKILDTEIGLCGEGERHESDQSVISTVSCGGSSGSGFTDFTHRNGFAQNGVQ